MAIVLEPKTSYNLISRTEPGNNKLLIHVKLTDSCLRALEEYQLVEVLSSSISRRISDSTSLCECGESKALILCSLLQINFIVSCLFSFNRYPQDESQALNFQDFKG